MQLARVALDAPRELSLVDAMRAGRLSGQMIIGSRYGGMYTTLGRGYANESDLEQRVWANAAWLVAKPASADRVIIAYVRLSTAELKHAAACDAIDAVPPKWRDKLRALGAWPPPSAHEHQQPPQEGGAYRPAATTTTVLMWNVGLHLLQMHPALRGFGTATPNMTRCALHSYRDVVAGSARILRAALPTSAARLVYSTTHTVCESRYQTLFAEILRAYRCGSSRPNKNRMRATAAAVAVAPLRCTAEASHGAALEKIRKGCMRTYDLSADECRASLLDTPTTRRQRAVALRALAAEPQLRVETFDAAALTSGEGACALTPDGRHYNGLYATLNGALLRLLTRRT